MGRNFLTLACATGFMMVAAPSYEAGSDVGPGKATYGELCAKCHGSSGKGDGKEAATLATKPKDLTDCARMSGFDDEKLFQVIKSGGPAGGLSKDMPGYADALEDDEMRDVLAYIQSLCRK